MKILHILEATEGGTRRHVLDLLPGLQARGVANTLAYSAVRNPRFADDARWLQSQDVECISIPMGHRWSRREDLAASAALRRYIREAAPDVVHCHSSNAGMLGRLASIGLGIPVVYTPHYVAFGAHLSPLQRRAARWIEKFLAPFTSHTIAVSQHEYSLLRRVLGLSPSKVSVVYNGVKLPATEYTAGATETFRVGCFGRLTAQKNQQVLLRAWPRVLKEIPDAKLRIVGGGEDESTLRALATRLRIEESIEWRGEVLEPMNEYSDCDVVAQPSRWEGCSYAILEAMSASRAVMASTAGGNPEVVSEAGVLLPPHDVLQWSNTIIELAQNRQRRMKMGQAARQRVAEYFGLETMLEKTLKIYRKVC